MCRYCNWCDMYSLRKLPKLRFRTEMDMLLSSHNSYPTMWVLEHPDSVKWMKLDLTRKFNYYKNHLLHFPKHGPRRLEKYDMFWSVTYLHQALLAITLSNHSFISSLRPKSYSTACESLCTNSAERLLPHVSYTELPYTDFLIPIECQPFRLVSCCGVHRTETIWKFYLLYNPFDKWIWI